MFHNFKEYMNGRKVIAKPKVMDVADEIDVPKPKAKDDPMNKNKYKGGPQPQLKEAKSDGKKLAGDPVVKVVADYEGKIPSSPSGGNPYAAPAVGKKSDKAKSGLGDAGDTEAGFPDKAYVKDSKNPNLPGGIDVKDEWPKGGEQKDKPMKKNDKQPQLKETKTEQFLEKTRDMSLREFTEYMLKECGCGGDMDGDLPTVTAYTAGKFHPHPPEAIKYVTVLANKNDRLMEHLVHEMKRAGMLGKLLKVLVDDHPESYGEFTNLLGDVNEGPNRANALVRSMNDTYSKFMDEQDGMFESVAPPFGLDDDEMDDHNPAMAGHSPDEGGEEDDDMAPTDEEPGDEPSEDMGDEEGPQQPPEKPSKKLKKRFAHDHMLKSMSSYDHMREKMKEYMGDM